MEGGRELNKYVFITPTIMDIGGAQKYVYSKTCFLKKQGFSVFIITSYKGERILNFTSPNFYYGELYFSPCVFGKKKITDIVMSIIESAHIDSNTIIESSTITMSQWAEIIAERTRAKHLCYSLEEDFSAKKRSLYDFIKFKSERGELAGINGCSVGLMLKHFECTTGNSQQYLLAMSDDPIKDISCDEALITLCNRVDYVIGAIGRTDKILFRSLLERIPRYSRMHPDKQFLLIFIGGPAVDIKLLEKHNSDNLTIVNTGYIYPIPEKLVRKLSVNIATAGSVRITAMYDIPSISTSAINAEVIGIFNYTTTKILYTEDGNKASEKVNLYHLLDSILFENYCRVHSPLSVLEHRPSEKIFDIFMGHMNYIRKSSQTVVYYNIKTITCNRYERMVYFFIFMFGSKFARYVYNVAIRMKRI